MRAVIAVALSARLIGGCAGGSGGEQRGGGDRARSDRLVDFSLKPAHVNALDIDPGSGDFLLTTNRGFVRIDAKRAGAVRGEPDRFKARGAEQLDLALSDGTTVSTEAGGKTWTTAFRP